MGYDTKVGITSIAVQYPQAYDKADPRVIWCNEQFKRWGWSQRKADGNIVFKFYRKKEAMTFALRWL